MKPTYFFPIAMIALDIGANKRIKTSRNLQRPTVQVKEHVKREYQRIERTGEIEVPKNYYLLKDDSFSVNEITGAVFNFSFLQLNARRWWEEDKAEDYL